MADDQSSATITITSPQVVEGLKYFLYAQQAYSNDWYASFLKDLGVKKIPYDYTNPRFLEAMVEFSGRFKMFLSEITDSEKRADSAAPPDVLHSLVKDLEEFEARVKKTKESRKESVVQKTVEAVKNAVAVTDETKLRQTLGQEISTIVAQAKNPQELKIKLQVAITRRLLEEAGKNAPVVENAVKSATETALTSAEADIAALVAEPPGAESITQFIVESRVARKELLVETLARQIETAGTANLSVTERLAATAEALQATPHGENLAKPFVLFQVGAKGWRKPLAVVVDKTIDVALTMFPKDYRDNVIESVLRKGLELQTEFGKRIVDSPLFETALKEGNQVFTNTSKPARGLGNALSGLASEFFSTPREDILLLIELGVIKAESITGYQQIYVAGAHSHSPGLFNLLFSEAAGWGIRKGAGALAAKAVGTWVGKALGFVAGLGTGFGALITSFIGGLIGGKVGSFLGSLFGRRPAGRPQSFWASPEGVAIIIIIGIIIGIPLLMSTQRIEEFGTFQKGQTGGEDVDLSRYIHVTKTANPSFFPDNNATSVTYTITVEATERALSGVTVRESSAVYAKSGKPAIPSVPETIPVSGDIAPGNPFTYEFTALLGPQYKDALIINTVTVKADAGDAKGEQSITSAIVTIGNPPAACFVPANSGPADTCGSGGRPTSWGGDWNMVIAASQKLAQYPGIMNASGCMENPITVYRVRTKFGGGCFSNGAIYLYNGGVSSFGSAVYTLAHELGHVIYHGTGCFEDFHAQNIYNREGYGGEGGLPTYPNDNTESEDFAETFGLYVGHTVYYPDKWAPYPKYPNSFPLHYNFADSLNKGTLSCK